MKGRALSSLFPSPKMTEGQVTGWLDSLRAGPLQSVDVDLSCPYALPGALPRPPYARVHRVRYPRDDAAGDQAQRRQPGAGLSRLRGPRGTETRRDGSDRGEFQSILDHLGRQT